MRTNRIKLVKIVFVIFTICIVWIFAGHFIKKVYHHKMKNKPKMYVYQTYWGTVNSVLYVEDISYADSLITYYQKIEDGNENPVFNFPPLSLPFDSCVYLIGFEKDSLVAKVISFYDYGKRGQFVIGYVYKNTIHKVPPPYSLILKN